MFTFIINIDNEILISIRANKKLLNNVSLQETIGIDKDGNEIQIEDKIADIKIDIDEEVSLKLEIVRLYDKIKSVLRGKEKVIIEERYGLRNGDEKTQREIAEMLGISRSYVSRIEKRALNKLNNEMAK